LGNLADDIANTRIDILVSRGVARNLLIGDKQEVWRTELPSGIQRQILGGGLEAKSLETGDKCACRLRK